MRTPPLAPNPIQPILTSPNLSLRARSAGRRGALADTEDAVVSESPQLQAKMIRPIQPLAQPPSPGAQRRAQIDSPDRHPSDQACQTPNVLSNQRTRHTNPSPVKRNVTVSLARRQRTPVGDNGFGPASR